MKSILRKASATTANESFEILANSLPALVWITEGTQGRTIFMSTQWQEYSGLSNEQLIGDEWMAILHPDDRERTNNAWAEAVAGRATYDIEYRLRRADGAYRWFKTRGIPVRDEQGTIVKWYGTCTDIQELVDARLKAEDASRTKTEFLTNISHDIRTPMNAIIGLSTILAGSALDAKQKEWVETLKQSAHGLLDMINNLLGVSPAASITPTPAAIPSANASILLVEDYPANIMVARTLLEQLGYGCDVAMNGFEAVEKFCSADYALILMDVQMHGMNGFEATAKIREYEQLNGRAPVPIIGLTAHALVGDKKRCIDAGMNDYIPKPIHPDELEEKLRTLIAAR